jgi:hypothetical protein
MNERALLLTSEERGVRTDITQVSNGLTSPGRKTLNPSTRPANPVALQLPCVGVFHERGQILPCLFEVGDTGRLTQIFPDRDVELVVVEARVFRAPGHFRGSDLFVPREVP